MSEAYKLGVSDAKRPETWIFDCPYCASKQSKDYEDWILGFIRTRKIQNS